METSKDELVEIIKQWITVDKEIKTLKAETKKRVLLKKQLTNTLTEIMRTNDIDLFDTKSGKLIYKKNKVRSALSKKHLIATLSAYFASNPDINPEEITNFVMDNRAIKETEDIKLKS